MREELRRQAQPDERFIGGDEVAYIAELRFGEANEASIECVKRGCGMIVNFPRGAGHVFHAGSCEWVAALLRGDPMVAWVTANVLDRYLTGGSPT